MHLLPQTKLNTPQAQNWAKILETIPTLPPLKITLNQDIIDIQATSSISNADQHTIISAFHSITPWRKGPYRVFGTLIDSEWQCQLKWKRIQKHLPNLSDKIIIDIGCNSGYFSFRLAGLGAKKIIAIDPSTLYFFQFHLLNKLINSQVIEYRPIGFKDLSPQTDTADLILNMGILYHHPTPLDSLLLCKNLLNKNGSLILETLYIEDPSPICLIPEKRYAGMKNIFQIPSIPQLTEWLNQCGFTSITILDQSTTTTDEQRSTPWSHPHSLKNVITDTLTIEGYPRPKRVVIKAQ